MTFVFCSLLELALVGYLATKDPRFNRGKRNLLKKLSQQHHQNMIVHQRSVNNDNTECEISCECITSSWTLEQIDKISAIAFPVLFILFNICYWWYYAWWMNVVQQPPK